METTVSTVDNLFDYFFDQVDQARVATSLSVSNDTTLYLASLLAERARADRPQLADTTTLAELHAHAAIGPPVERARTYRELGDRALYVLGFFRESLDRRTVGPAYYEVMGAAAYRQVDQVFRRWFSDAFGPVFRELANRFRGCAAVLAHVRDAHESNPDPIDRLYEHWLQTGSPESAARLRALGLLVRPDTVDEA